MKISLQKAHPWHGIDLDPNTPHTVVSFIEIVPTDTIKYEIDKASGYLKVDRPQKFSNLVPTLYGFIPKTYCGATIAKLASDVSKLEVKKGDGDPLDICILTSHTVAHGDIILKAKPIGGFCLIDKEEADDKVIAVLEGDPVFGAYCDISEIPAGIIAKLRHYFLTYKNLPNEPAIVSIAHEYGTKMAHQVILCAIDDYKTLISS